MKTITRAIVLSLLIFTAFGAQAQCSNQLSTLSYDTSVTGLGNEFYTFTFPKFDATLGTLTEIKIDTKITLVYNFTLENGEPNPVTNYRVKVFRDDDISSTALLNPLSNSYQKQYGYYSLAASDGITGSGPDFTQQGPLYVMNQQPVSYSVNNTADYLGVGSVDFDYSTSTFSAAQGSINNTLNGSADDAVNFKITYTYCPALVLAADITSFTVQKLNNDVIDLKWITQNEKTNRKYELQKSTDGRNYRSVAEFTAAANTTQTGSYRYSYQVQSADNNQTLLFRLKQVETNGVTKYSPVHAIKLTSKTDQQPRLYPNPAKGASTLLFNNVKRGNWDVQLFTVNGQLLKQYHFNNALLGKLNTGNELAKGVYMVKCVNKTTEEQYIQQLIVE